MESLGAISEGEWGSFSAMYSNEESEFMAQLLNNCPIPNDSNGGTASSFKIPCTTNNNYHLSLGSTDYSGSSSYFFPTSSHDQSYNASNSNQILLTNVDSVLDYYMVEAKNNNLLEGDNFLSQEMSSGCSMEEFSGNLPEADIGKETHFPELELSNEVELNKLVQKSKKRCNLEDVRI